MEYLILLLWIYGFLGVLTALFYVWLDEYLRPGLDLLIIIPGIILVWPYCVYKVTR